MGINKWIYKNKWEKLNPPNDLKHNDLNGHIESIESKCYRKTKTKEPKRFLDEIETNNNYYLFFNHLGFISQKIIYHISFNFIKTFEIYLFEYFSNNLVKSIREYNEDNELKTTANFKYVVSKNKLTQRDFESKTKIKEYKISKYLEILPSITFIGLPYRKGVIEYFYDNQGNIVKEVNTNNDITKEYTYEGNLILTTKKTLNITSKPLLLEVAHHYFDQSGLKKIEYFNSDNELQRTDTFENDKHKNWIKKEIIYHKAQSYLIERRIKYYDIKFPDVE
tara:strand:- start:18 stop:854 length:837 start_codon:yes stop_codon:yes gene_type:complete